MIKKQTSAGGIVYKIINNQHYWLVVKNLLGEYWGFPKGLVGDKDKSETLEQAALREVQEEGGIKAKIIKKINYSISYTYVWNNIQIDKTVWFFLMKYLSGNQKDHDKEIEEAKFVKTDTVLKMLTHDNDKEVFKKALKVLPLGFEPRTPDL